MNPVIQAQLREFVKANSLDELKADRQFEVYSIFAILNGMHGEKIDAYEVHLNGDEFGIDGIAILVQGELVRDYDEAIEKLTTINNAEIEFIFFQSKTSTGYDYGDISKFFDGISEFFEDEISDSSETLASLQKAKQAVYEKGVGKRNPKLSCYYATTGNYESPARIEKLKSNFIEKLKEKYIFDSEAVSVHLIGARELQQCYRAATTAAEVEIEFARNVVMPANSHVDEAYLGFIDAKNLLKLYTIKNSESEEPQINRTVFFDNIRDYDADSKINLAIKQSVGTDGGNEFVFRNNGITVVSKSIDRTGDKFRLEDFQIVNGCQTCNVIFDLVYNPAAEKTSGLADAIHVPFRLIGSKDDTFVSSIIVGTNSQNPVREEQFWALRPFMKSLEEYCRNLSEEQAIYIERRDNQYRTQPKIERTRIMQPSVLMKAVGACLLFQPQRAARDYRGIVAEYEKTIFLNDHDVHIYHAVAYLYYRLEFLWRNQRIDNSSKTFRYYILAGIGIEITKNQTVFSLKKGDRDKIASEFLSLCGDEKRLTSSVSRIVSIIDEQLKKQGATQSQERIRDAIRSETFFTQFRASIVA